MLSPKLSTGVAFDKFDRFVETSSGKDTLRDTVEILFKNEPDEGTFQTISQHFPSISSQNISRLINNIDSTSFISIERKEKTV